MINTLGPFSFGPFSFGTFKLGKFAQNLARTQKPNSQIPFVRIGRVIIMVDAKE